MLANESLGVSLTKIGEDPSRRLPKIEREIRYPAGEIGRLISSAIADRQLRRMNENGSRESFSSIRRREKGGE